MPQPGNVTLNSQDKSKSPPEHFVTIDIQLGHNESEITRLSCRSWLESLSIETGGIERVTDEARASKTSKVWNACTFWYDYYEHIVLLRIVWLTSSRMSANMAIATLNTGMVSGSMGLSFWDCFAIIVLVNCAACTAPAWTATFGLTGLRMTTFSRYSFGYWGNILVVIFSMISTTGWNAINSISGASALYAVSDGKFPHWAGVIVICTSVWIICVLGITWIHKLDAYLWIGPLIVWCVAAGTGAKHLDVNAIKSPTGGNGAAAAFSTIAIIFSFAVSWINCAADYNVKMPANTPRWKIFVATYIGITVPTVLVQTLGAALYTGTVVNLAWKAAYHEAGVGGPLKLALAPAGWFGKILLVVAALSSIPVSHFKAVNKYRH